MPDQLFDSLSDDVTVRPLPASEVRRRGDRRRRTRHAALGVAGLAAAIAVAVPITLGNGSADRSVAPSTNTPSAAVTTIPAGFPLTAGMPRRDGVSNQPLTAGPLTSEEEKACGQVVWSAQRPIPTVGGATVTYRDGSEGGQSRSLALYADEEQAGRALRAIDLALSTCGTDQAAGTSFEQVTTPTATGSAEVWVVRWIDDKGHPTGEGMISSATRVGNALLLHSETFGSAGDDSVVQYEAGRIAHSTTPVIASMCVFSANGCATTQDSTTPTTPASDVLGPTGYDRLRIGMSYADALATGEVGDRSDGAANAALAGRPDAGLCLSKKDGLMAIFLGAGMHTPEGIRIGSSTAELQAAYPGLKPYGPDSKLGRGGIFRADAGKGLWYEIDVEQTKQVSTVILRQDHQTCFE